MIIELVSKMYSRILYKGNSLIIRATFIMNSWIILYRCKEEIQHFFFNTKFVSQEYFYIFEFKHQIFRHWNRTVLECFQKKKKRNTEIFIETEFQKSLKLIDSDKQIYILFKYFDHPRGFARSLERYFSFPLSKETDTFPRVTP